MTNLENSEMIAKAVRLFIEEITLADNAEECEASFNMLHTHKAALKQRNMRDSLLEQADEAMGEAWDMLEEAGMSNIDISHLRFESHSSIAKKLSWPNEGAIRVKDRAYPWKHDGLA